jgi:hypothetical protein
MFILQGHPGGQAPSGACQGAKRLECVELAPAFVGSRPSDSASKLDALHTLGDLPAARTRMPPGGAVTHVLRREDSGLRRD